MLSLFRASLLGGRPGRRKRLGQIEERPVSLIDHTGGHLSVRKYIPIPGVPSSVVIKPWELETFVDPERRFTVHCMFQDHDKELVAETARVRHLDDSDISIL